ncbi:MAG: hypothetical protein J5I92_09210 [Thiogranum sp.]|nr:hypothetical protein [Thiogranum sp.]
MNGYKLIIDTARRFIGCIGVVSICGLATAAEVSGTVSLDHHGLSSLKTGVPSHVISVALIPGQGQLVERAATREQKIEIRDNRMHPSFLTVQKGDRVEFVNRDAVFHQLFSLSRGEPVSIQLGKPGGQRASRTSFEFKEPGTTHFFCRIHKKSYARIDVVDTPYLQAIQPGQSFHFAGLAPGKWKLRVASAAAETQWIEVRALTSPPPLHLTLAYRDSVNGFANPEMQSDIEQLFR